jgi:hypothetical protein
MSTIIDFLSPYWGFLVALVGGAIALFLGLGKAKSDGKKEGVAQERTKQVEQARAETKVAVETRNTVQAQPQSKTDADFSKYVRKPK